MSRVLNSRRIARSLVTILALTLVQSIAAPVLIPKALTQKAEAVEVTYTSATRGSDIVVPAGVSSVTLTARGGAGGSGGKDASSLGLAGSNVGFASGTFSVSPGDRITFFPGSAGGNGANDAQNSGGGIAGQTSIETQTNNSLTPAFKFNGVYSSLITISGGKGGNAGSTGTSGSGGGGGAGSMVAINEDVALIAAGAGGGAGGSGPGAQPAATPYNYTTLALGGAGTYGGGCGNADGGGGGGGGGGWNGGVGGASPQPTTGSECQGFGGSPGANFVASNAQSAVSNQSTTPNGAGAITYVFNYDAVSNCATDAQVVDIYTVVKITNTGDCTWSVPATVSVVDLFLVGGGGGGAGDGGVGGNGGAALSRSAVPVTPNTSLRVKAGYGGAGTSWNFISKAFAGDSTTVVTSSGNVFYALGGATGNSGPSQTPGTVATPQSGAFAGGLGGTASTAVNTVGGAGKRGVSNYFYGTQNTYAGGGGGGIFTNSSASAMSGGTASDGGGAGATESSGGVNSPGSNGVAASGGGGGGGTAVGTGYRVSGGKGGSGVILIRYATNAADSFPSALAASVAGRWTPNELQVLDSNRKGWVDSSGTYTAGAVTGSPSITTTGTTDGVNATGSTKTNLSAAGDTGAKATFVSTNIPTYTIFHIARYATGGTQRRIITASNNWLSGHYASDRYKAAYHVNDWMTPQVSADYKWLLSTDQVKMYRANGRDVSYNVNASQIYNSTTGPTGLGINAYANEESSWQFLDLIAFNRVLSAGEIRSMEIYLAKIYGLSLETDSQNAETDTAATFDGNQYMYTQYGYGERMNDTFTVGAWVKPASTCAVINGVWCGFFARENTLLLSVHNGTIWYAMYGSSSAWEYIDTGIKAPINEWHNYTVVKRGIANTADSFDLYVDGQWAWTKSGNPYRSGTVTYSAADVLYDQNNQWTYIGTRLDTYERMYGQIDEEKIWKVARTASQILADIHSNDATSPQLQFYWDFNRGTGTSTFNVPNLAQSGPSRSDLVLAGTNSFTDVKVTTTSGPYTTLTFPRTYITQTGGWKVPSNLSSATTIVVGGGGGAGKSVSDTSSPGGAGGGGGVNFSGNQTYLPGTTVSVKVGTGGIYASSIANDASIRNGGSSVVVISSQSTLTAMGGGGGGSFGYVGAGSGAGDASIATGGGGGGIAGVCTDNGAAGGTVSSGYNGGLGTWGWGGAGGGARGAAVLGTCGNGSQGSPGSGYVDSIASIEYGRGGYNNSYTTWSAITGTTTANNGWGGSVAYNGSSTSGVGRQGSAGVVVIRYLTASKPTFTYPTNAYLNVGMTETFTTNVSQDSATAMLTRTFKWESTTTGSGGTYSTIKQGTGAANAAFSWVPSDTSTTGSQYLYRVVVTDSDTAGLSYTDTSTSVYAVINGTLKMAGVNSIKKTINIARNETFTISAGTPNYRYTLSPVLKGVTLDTSTPGTTILKISDTASVGTYIETLTVTDSVSASVSIPITLSISSPPTLVNSSQIIENDLVFNIDMANTSSYSRATGTISDISGTKKLVTINGGSTFSDDYSGILKLSNTQYISATGFTTLPSFTIEAYINLQSIGANQVCVFGSEQTSVNVAYFMCIDGGRTVFTGFYNGYWTYKRTSQQLTLGAWTHLVGTFDSTTAGTKMELYFNGSVATLSDSAENAGLVPPIASSDKAFINKWFYTSTTPTSAMDIGFVRLYSAPFTQARVTQNYNATKDRFTSANQTQIKPIQKYGVLNLESFTVTSGGDTKTISFAIGNRQGIQWDTSSTPGQVKLSVQESLTPGTYYDTITVTDEYSSSTSLPIKFTVTKADTLTVYVDTPTALSYTGSRANFSPTVKTIGAVGLESGTVLSSAINYKPAGTTCATGGYCRVGDIGPGGGIVFIDTSTASSDGRIYEVAPQNWSGSDDLSTIGTYCSNDNSNLGATQVGIGWGETNTNLAKASCLGGAVARVNTFNAGNSTGYSDWFIPSKNEAIELAKIPATAGLLNIGNNWTTGKWGYWASTEVSSSVMWSIGHAGASFAGSANVSKSEANQNMVRPVRAFKSCWAIDTCTAIATTDTPTAAGVYVITPTALTNSADILSKYSAITYMTSRLTINRIAQRAQVIPFINTNYPETFTVNVTEGNGNGAVTFSAVNGTASGCAFDYKKLYTTSQGTCTVTIAKAGDRNYLPDTVTANVLFLAFVINQPSPAVGSGPTIALSGATSITLDPNAAPTISSLSTYTATAGSTQIIINGAGFNHLDLASITVKFWRNITASGFTVNAGDSQITVTVPVGATTGKVTVTTPNGIAVSELSLTITP